MNEELLHDQIFKSEIEAERGIDLSKLVLDVCKRDQEGGGYNIDCIFYVAPGVAYEQVAPAVQKACIDLFGSNPGETISLFYNDGTLDGENPLSVIVQDKPTVCESFGFSILHPESVYYSDLQVLKNIIFQQVKKHL